MLENFPWWIGYNAALRGQSYHNNYTTVTAKYEYQKGYDAACNVDDKMHLAEIAFYLMRSVRGSD